MTLSRNGDPLALIVRRSHERARNKRWVDLEEGRYQEAMHIMELLQSQRQVGLQSDR